MNNISIIVAVSDNYEIGKNNQLLCHLPNDLKRFKAITSGHKIFMGRKTFLSLPNGALPNRENYVISHNPKLDFSNVTTANSIDSALSYMSREKENFIIGGSEIYAQFFPLAERIYLTQIHHIFSGDVFFPTIDFSKWHKTEEKHNLADEKHKYNYSFINLIKKQ